MKNSKKAYGVELKTVDEIDCENYNYEHFNDGYIDLRVIPTFCLWVATNVSGETKVFDFDDNFFSTEDLLEAYESLWHDDWCRYDYSPETTKEKHIAAFKRWLIDIGTATAPELLDA